MRPVILKRKAHNSEDYDYIKKDSTRKNFLSFKISNDIWAC